MLIFLQRKSKSLFVILSGTHGPEEYIGSAIQTRFLRELEKFPQNVLDETGFLFVHGVNPYGMAHFRRENSENIDLNRSALNPKQRQNDPNPLYGEYHFKIIDPTPPEISWFDYLQFLGKAVKVTFEIGGFKEARQVIANGQYSVDNGIFYGGSSLPKQLKRLVITLSSMQRSTRKFTLSTFIQAKGLAGEILP